MTYLHSSLQDKRGIQIFEIVFLGDLIPISIPNATLTVIG